MSLLGPGMPQVYIPVQAIRQFGTLSAQTLALPSSPGPGQLVSLTSSTTTTDKEPTWAHLGSLIKDLSF